MRATKKYFLSMFSIIIILIQRNIHRYTDDIYAMSVSIDELTSIKNSIKNMSNQHAAQLRITKTNTQPLYDAFFLHNQDRLCQYIDDCLYRLKNMQNNIIKDKYIAIKTIDRLDAELNK